MSHAFDLPVNTTPMQQLQTLLLVDAPDHRQLWNFAHVIAMDETESFADRISALKVMDDLIGEEDLSLDDPDTAAAALASYVSLFSHKVQS